MTQPTAPALTAEVIRDLSQTQNSREFGIVLRPEHGTMVLQVEYVSRAIGAGFLTADGEGYILLRAYELSDMTDPWDWEPGGETLKEESAQTIADFINTNRDIEAERLHHTRSRVVQ